LKIIGISCYYHDAAVAIIENGHLLFAAQEERYSRVKNDADFPLQALSDGLCYCGLSMKDIDAVVFYEKPFLKFERLIDTYLSHAPKGLVSFIKAMNVWTDKKLFIKSDIRKQLQTIDPGFDAKHIPLLFSEHHLSHAASTFYPSPFRDAAILTVDGVGEYTTTALAKGNGREIEILREIHFPHSIGLLYSAVTYFLGFKVNSDEYKVMGLAAYGQPEHPEVRRFLHIFEEQLITILQDGSYRLNMAYFTYPYTLRMVDDRQWEQLWGCPKRQPEDPINEVHCHLAYALQKITEKMVLQLCREVKRLTHSDYLCLSGGVALNSVINGIIADQQIFKKIFIQPAGNDAGGALGAALAAYYLHFGQERNCTEPDSMQNSLLGSDFSQEELDNVTRQHPAHDYFADTATLCDTVAAHIANGKVTGWVQGRMEFGPRALGNRSILGDPRNTEMQKHLNLSIKNRESFRPFAPAVLEEEAQEWFDISCTSPYMLQVHPVNKKHLKAVPEDYSGRTLSEKLYTIKSDIPAVTHVDFSARIQTVNKANHPLFHQLISAFKTQTGCPMLINTSFNIKDEPIVRTPEDAYRCFLKTKMDILVIGNYIFYK
jgi:carbamoyltransferase